MIPHHGFETTRTPDGLARLQPTLRYGVIARSIERGKLLQYQRLALLYVDLQLLPDVARFFDGPAQHIDWPSVEERPRARGLGDMNVRLVGAHQQAHAVLADGLACYRLQVLAVEFSVQLRACVDDPPVDRRTDRYARRPILGSQSHFQRTQVHVVHRDQTPLLQQAASPLLVFEAQGPP